MIIRFQNFSSELTAGRRIRLIYNGGVLDEAAIFSSLAIPENAILICSISSDRIVVPVFYIDRFGGWFNLWILFGSFLGVFWSAYFALDGKYFSRQTIGLLVLMTAGLFLWILLTVVPATSTRARQNENAGGAAENAHQE